MSEPSHNTRTGTWIGRSLRSRAVWGEQRRLAWQPRSRRGGATDLGASRPAGTRSITLFIPSVDRDGQPIDQGTALDEALRVFGKLSAGSSTGSGASGGKARSVW